MYNSCIERSSVHKRKNLSSNKIFRNCKMKKENFVKNFKMRSSSIANVVIEWTKNAKVFESAFDEVKLITLLSVTFVERIRLIWYYNVIMFFVKVAWRIEENWAMIVHFAKSLMTMFDGFTWTDEEVWIFVY